MIFFQSSKQVVQKTDREDNRQTENLFQHTVSMVKSETDGYPALSCTAIPFRWLRRIINGSVEARCLILFKSHDGLNVCCNKSESDLVIFFYIIHRLLTIDYSIENGCVFLKRYSILNVTSRDGKNHYQFTINNTGLR